ncbi:patatin-like phospholipase family protein [Mucilaginibacter terrenus]|uniref:Patatin-like phospholipase family protein n=1 Tax=Mucilaginibacter terrenus TaxID=2482727 RepID=A0A3E2NTE1_9SPHI|nr:patatin-like phospholipase family protein [Mucilaginibacter terrenus]RFZ84191.1 patatin-like phospholipase family protein [Mucilaginibacter terrenus]
MDIITDLTAHAVSYITIYQDICKDKFFSGNKIVTNDYCSQEQYNRIKEVFMSRELLDENMLKEQFSRRVHQLYSWIKSGGDAAIATVQMTADNDDIYQPPTYWRKKIRAMLFADANERSELARILNYVPIQVILAMGGNKIKNYDRTYQAYDNTEQPKETPTTGLIKNPQRDKWWAGNFEKKPRRSLTIELLENNERLKNCLITANAPLPFDTFFTEELKEVEQSRESRRKELEPGMVPPSNTPEHALDPDPFLLASDMKLKGLALSGGGIRSATFSLGVIQKLAYLGQLSSFDYLSTVSGGGYIGSWLISWIKRGGSVTKVSNRLNPAKSTDPMADEVRPIRWLRMYSNYLSPNASIMSADAWTTGMTWLRNTIINQCILLLLLLSVLALVSSFFNLWRIFQSTGNNYSTWSVGIWSFILLAPAAFLTGFGMRGYKTMDGVNTKPLIANAYTSFLMVFWAALAGCIISSWLYAGLPELGGYVYNGKKLWPVAAVGTALMITVATIGKYASQASAMSTYKIYFVPGWLRIWCWIILSSLVAAAVGLAAVTAVWTLFCNLPVAGYGINNFYEKEIFILGPPLIIEVVCISIVARMALMGLLFPDEKREWWGRMGGIVHRFILLWLLVTAGALLLPDYIRYNSKNMLKELAPILGTAATWAGLVGAGVKMAFNAASEGKKSDPGKSKAADIFVRFVPYLFMVGFLLIGAYTLEALTRVFVDVKNADAQTLASCFGLLSGGLIVITWLVSWRTGVNEFSLHHFYRNRLTRAYLGATRRRDDRDNTANSFTGFDQRDDLPLTDFKYKGKNGRYIGPYPILNTALNATDASELDRQDRMAESFIFSPLYCGFDFSATKSAINNKSSKFNYGYRNTDRYSAPMGPQLGSVMAMSGAAVSPNMGYHSSAATAFLLTMFNVRLGRWIGNPRQDRWKHSEPTAGIGYLVKDLVGDTDIDNDYVYLSDGGHFDNMGLYELVRRKCSTIVLVDGEQDSKANCEGLANAIRRCRIDFGVEIEIDTTKITKKAKDTGFSLAHAVTGKIHYPGVTDVGELIYVKTTLTEDNATDVREYYMSNPEFPQESTGDQFFNEAQFESYRKLGYLSIDKSMFAAAK